MTSSPDQDPELQAAMEEAVRNLEMPVDPVGGLDQAIVAWRTVFDAFAKAEFTNAQALYLTAAFMNGTPGTAPRA